MEKKTFQKVAGLITGLSLIATSCLPAAAAEPNITLQLNTCGENAGIEVPADKLLKLSVPGQEATVRLNKDGTVSVGEVTATSGSYEIGDRTKDHMLVDLLGDPDGNGRPNLSVTSICPAPTPPTIAPSSFNQFDLKGSGRYASINNQRGGYSSKPIQSQGAIFRGGRRG